jgi:hypothetical protein
MGWAQLIGAGLSFLSSPRPPSQDQINAALAAQAAADRQKLVAGAALFGGALLVFALTSRR